MAARKSKANPTEFYATPAPFTRCLFGEMADRDDPIGGQLFEPTVGSGAIVQATRGLGSAAGIDGWITNDIDPRWPADIHGDATEPWVWLKAGAIHWTIGNPAFSIAERVVHHALNHSTIGVAMHLRISINEVLRKGARRTWLRQAPPTGLIFLSRYAYQRSPKTGKWTTDSVCACWMIWQHEAPKGQFIQYADEWVIEELDAETLAYRAEMDRIAMEILL